MGTKGTTPITATLTIGHQRNGQENKHNTTEETHKKKQTAEPKVARKRKKRKQLKEKNYNRGGTKKEPPAKTAGIRHWAKNAD